MDSNTGNCSELSAVAFLRLVKASTRPVEYYAVFRGKWNHAFLILDRDSSVPFENFRDWSSQAVGRAGKKIPAEAGIEEPCRAL